MGLALSWLFLAWQVPVTDLITEGTKAIESGRYAEAIKILSNAVAKSPEDVAALFHLALAQALSGNDAEAIETYRKTLKHKPDLYEAQVNLGQLLLRQKEYPEAETWLASALQRKPTDPKLNSLLGQTYLALKKGPEAEARYRVLVEVEPKSPESWMGLAHALSLQNKPLEAAQAIEKATPLDPENRDLVLQAATYFEAAGKRQEAIDLYGQAPNNPAARERLGNLLLQEGKPGEAIPHLEFVQAQAPTDAGRFALAVAYLRNKQPDRSIPLVEKILETDPRNTEIRMFYGRLLRDQRRFIPAANQFQKVAAAQPDSAEAWNELAGVLVLAELYPEAVQALEQVRKVQGESAAYHYFRALSLDHMKQYKPALDSYKRFLELSQNQSPDEEFKARQRIIVIQKVLSK